MKKGNVIPATVFIVLAVMVVGMGIAAFQSFKTTTIDPAASELESATGRLGQMEITIGDREEAGPEEARKEMQGAVVWSMLAASDCRLLTPVNGISSVGEFEDADSENFGDEFEIEDDYSPPDGDPIDGKLLKRSYEQFNEHVTSTSPKNRKNIYTGYFQSFIPMTRSGFDNPCIGAGSVIQKIEDATESAAGEAANSVISKTTTVASGGLALTGVGIPAAIGTYYAGNLAGSLAEQTIAPGGGFASDKGYSMEGNVNRIDFQIEETFMMDEISQGEEGKRPFFGMSLKLESNLDKAPPFWGGERFSYLVPPGLESMGLDSSSTFSADSSKEHLKNGEVSWENNMPTVQYRPSPGAGNSNVPIFDLEDSFSYKHGNNDNHITGKTYGTSGPSSLSYEEWFYAFRPRMVNVPIVSNEELDDSLTFFEFKSNTRYLFCEGASGMIQSNAQSIDNTGISSGNSPVSDTSFPKVEINSGAKSCIETNPVADDIVDESSVRCEDPSDMFGDGGSSETVFNRETTGGEIHTAKVVCGGRKSDFDLEDPSLNIESSDEEIEYFYPQKSLTGCQSNWYNLAENVGPSWIYGIEDVEEIDTEVDGSNQLDLEEIELEFENKPDSIQSFEIVVEMNSEKIENDLVDHTAVIQTKNTEGAEFGAAVFKEYSARKQNLPTGQTGVNIYPVENNVLKLDLKEGNMDLNGQRLISDYLPEEANGGIVQSVEINELSSDELESYNDELGTDEFEEENSENLEFLEINGKGFPKVCR